MEDKRLTTEQAAEIVGKNAHIIREYCRQGTIKGEKFGRQWVVLESEARRYRLVLDGKEDRKKREAIKQKKDTG